MPAHRLHNAADTAPEISQSSSDTRLFFARAAPQIDALINSLQETLEKKGSDVRVGIIGGGSVGLALLRALLHCGTFSPDRIRLSTRCPENLLDFQVRH